MLRKKLPMSEEKTKPKVLHTALSFYTQQTFCQFLSADILETSAYTKYIEQSIFLHF